MEHGDEPAFRPRQLVGRYSTADETDVEPLPRALSEWLRLRRAGEADVQAHDWGAPITVSRRPAFRKPLQDGRARYLITNQG